MTFHNARSGMVAGDRQDRWFFPQQYRQRCVEFLNGLFLRREIPVLTLHVRVLVMNEEEIVIVVFGYITVELLGDGLWYFQLRHSDKLRQALVHRIDGNADGPQTVTIAKCWDDGLVDDVAKQQ